MTRATIAVCVPIHLRGGSADHLSPAMKRLRQLNCPVLLCGSEGDHSQRELAKYCRGKIKYHEVPQGPVCTSSSGDAVLRAKYNDSLAALVEHAPKADWYCMVGANDVVSHSFWWWLKNTKEAGPAIYGVNSNRKLFLSDDNGGIYMVELAYRNSVKLLPGINAFNHQALEVLRGNPYRVHGCEVGLEAMAGRLGIKVEGVPGAIWSIKAGPNLNSFQHIARHHTVRELTEDERYWWVEAFGELC